MRKKEEEQALKKFVEELLLENIPRFQQEFNSLEGKAYVDRFLSLSEYVLAKLSRQEVSQELEIPVTINLVTGKQQKMIEIGDEVEYEEQGDRD